MISGAQRATVQGIAESRTQLRRRQWHPTPVFLPGESQGWGHTESDTTEAT